MFMYRNNFKEFWSNNTLNNVVSLQKCECNRIVKLPYYTQLHTLWMLDVFRVVFIHYVFETINRLKAVTVTDRYPLGPEFRIQQKVIVRNISNMFKSWLGLRHYYKCLHRCSTCWLHIDHNFTLWALFDEFEKCNWFQWVPEVFVANLIYKYTHMICW